MLIRLTMLCEESLQHSTSKSYKNGDSVKIFIVKASVQHTGRNKYWRQTASWEGQLGCYITSAGNHQPQDHYVTSAGNHLPQNQYSTLEVYYLVNSSQLETKNHIHHVTMVMLCTPRENNKYQCQKN